MERSSGYACEPVSGGVKSKTTLLGRLFAHFALVYRGLQFALTRHALSMVSLTCFCTFLCSKGMFDIKFNTSMTILAAGTIFPLVFSVQAGFSRRDEALSSLAKLKGAMITIFLMFKTWEKDTDGRWMWEKQAQHQAPAHGVWATEVENAFDKLIDDIEIYLRGRPATALQQPLPPNPEPPSPIPNPTKPQNL